VPETVTKGAGLVAKWCPNDEKKRWAMKKEGSNGD